MATEKAEGSAPIEPTAQPTGTASSGLTAGSPPAAQGTSPPLAEGAVPELPGKWMAALDPEIQSDKDALKMLEGFKRGLPDVVKAFVELKRQPQGIRIPDASAKAEDVAAFRKAIGVPEKPEDYKLEKVELPGQLELDGKWSKELKELAHKLNLSQGQLGGLHDWYFKNLVAEMQVVKTTAEQAHQSLRKEMGATDYEAAMTYMNRATKKFLTPEGAVLYARTGMGNHPETLKMWIAIGKAMGEHFFAEGTRGEKTESAPFGKRTDAELAEALYPKKE